MTSHFISWFAQTRSKHLHPVLLYYAEVTQTGSGCLVLIGRSQRRRFDLMKAVHLVLTTTRLDYKVYVAAIKAGLAYAALHPLTTLTDREIGVVVHLCFIGLSGAKGIPEIHGHFFLLIIQETCCPRRAGLPLGRGEAISCWRSQNKCISCWCSVRLLSMPPEPLLSIYLIGRFLQCCCS